jgi:hypothetical protein
MNYDITTGVQTVTATGPVTGVLSTASLTGDLTLFLELDGLPAGGAARVSVEDSATNFGSSGADALPVAVAHELNLVVPGAPVTHTWRKYNLGTIRAGATNTALRVNVLELTGGSLSVHGYLQA